MMLKIDENLLNELGLGGLSVDEKNRMLAQIYESLEMRVGVTLARQMSDAQLQEFEAFINSNDEAGALNWLESNFPNYKDVVAQELEKLKVEIRANAQNIIQSLREPQTELPPPPNQPVPQQPAQPPAQSMPPTQPEPIPQTPPAPSQPAQPPVPPTTPAASPQQPPQAPQTPQAPQPGQTVDPTQQQ
ncbi:MAG: DUF5663 domain-containing protein [Candidatus Saccharimonadales bacterium]|nr:DUF5663 domain-containing protein [Candidatus Saccharimonadales bacterium]